MSTLYIRLVSKAAADDRTDWSAMTCMFAQVSHRGTIERQGMAPLMDLSGTAANAQRVVVLLAGSDVTMLRLLVPPLSPARLKAALPNLVEDHLLADPGDCVVVAGAHSDGLRTIAVVQRGWLESLVNALKAFGVREISVFPAQLCLPSQTDQPGSVTAAVSDVMGSNMNAAIEITLRLSEQDGVGLTMAHEADESAAHAALQALSAVVPDKPVVLYVPQSMVRAYQQEASDTLALGRRISVSADDWPRWIAGANLATLDLMAGLAAETGPSLDWRRWRWPLALAAAVLITNLAALNIGWWHMKSESNSLRAAMMRIYKSAYPNEAVIIDPLAQMRRKIAVAKQDSGAAAPDDFTAIAAALGEAWPSAATTAGQPAAAIAALEYHDHSLFVRLKPAANIPTQQMQTALAKFDLTLELDPAQAGAVVWKIRSTK